jgi:hypothetical protein
MTAKLSAWFTTGSGLTLVLLFLGAGLTAIQTHFTGSVAADIGTVVAIIGLIAHPTNMVAGRSVPKQ